MNQTIKPATATVSSSLARATRPVASFIFQNMSSSEAKRLCLIPGHYDTASTASRAEGTSAPFLIKSYLSYADPTAIKMAGYDCDQVADDFDATSHFTDASGSSYPIRVESKSSKTRYRDFLNYIKVSGLKVTKMRITHLGSDTAREIFYSEIEVSKSSIGSKAGSDFIQLASYINPNHYLQNFIDIDLEKENLLLDETTLVFLNIPGHSHFQIDFTLAPTL